MADPILSKLQLFIWADEGTFHKNLKKTHMNLLSYAAKSIPTLASKTRPVAQIPWERVAINKFTIHKDASITLHTTDGNVRFWKKGTVGIQPYRR